MKRTFELDRADHEQQPEEGAARLRLLQAALRLFGEHGYNAISVRDLAREAKVNLAAVNYHFGSKENLRLEALRYGFAPVLEVAAKLEAILEKAKEEQARERSKAEGGMGPAEEALRRFIRIFLFEVIGLSGDHWSMFMRERMNPSPDFDQVMEQYFRPIGKALGGILRLLLPGADDAQIGMCLRSVIGQCAHIRIAEPMVRRFAGYDPRDEAFLASSAKHIGEFSVLALRGLREQNGREQNGKVR